MCVNMYVRRFRELTRLLVDMGILGVREEPDLVPCQLKPCLDDDGQPGLMELFTCLQRDEEVFLLRLRRSRRRQ